MRERIGEGDHSPDIDDDQEPDGECMNCSAAWPQGEKQCPECGWDGIDDRGLNREWSREIAREEGMLNGIDSYNDWGVS